MTNTKRMPETNTWQGMGKAESDSAMQVVERIGEEDGGGRHTRKSEAQPERRINSSSPFPSLALAPFPRPHTMTALITPTPD
jgi:hypothetical protein